jgi:chromosomal replication initiation ATPase DnaA
MAKVKKERIKIPQEVAEKVIALDCREESNIRRLEKFLMKLPFVKDEEDITTDNLEILIKKIELKYMVHLAYIMRSVVDGEDMYSSMIKTDVETKGDWVKTVYGQTFWETLAKTLFYMYYHIEGRKK